MFKHRQIIVWVVGLLVILLASLGYYLGMNIKTHKEARIKKGGIRVIIDDLSNQGYDVGTIDKYLLYIIGTPKIGVIEFGSKKYVNRFDFLRQITELSSSHKQEKIMLIPGETLEIFFDDIAKKHNLDSKKLFESYKELSPYPESGIKPDTYFIPTGINEYDLVQLMVDISEKEYEKQSISLNGSYNKEEWKKILTMASIIQKESANIKEMPIVASVIQNRLNKNMRLQMDGTLNYGKYSHVAVTSERIKEDNSSFNTYKNYGLPISPIGSAQKEAIEAAISPAKTDYLYFVKNASGVHTFTNNFGDHRTAIKKGRN